ncbi:Transcriptional regulator, AraC family [Clostridium tyrobutyricum DIVETGP]|jgi:hypothetical protein|uniref:Transcriptional regulator, AraC family n=1 Tax=Clostridium tyrobutyricum DIVETGP TaxID=1408889 RepID=W6NFW9_CLOTY|nr:hypothetical protein EZN00_02038 [Clostridium tyrobutyricum]CDL90967.1 Transcriptional regulator, AraC family [Clostridium tyrobutyricum DIVETGP]
MEQKYCQSCGMPLSEELYGTELSKGKIMNTVYIAMKRENLNSPI